MNMRGKGIPYFLNCNLIPNVSRKCLCSLNFDIVPNQIVVFCGFAFLYDCSLIRFLYECVHLIFLYECILI